MREKVRHVPLPDRLWRLKPLQWLIVDAIDWLFQFVIVNLCWILLSLTVILLPPAFAALYDVAYQAYRGVPPNPRAFFMSVRRRFWQAWAWVLVNGVIFGALFLIGRRSLSGDVFLTALVVLLTLAFLAQFYFWAYVVVQEEVQLGRALRNSLFTALGDLMYVTLYLAITVAVFVPSVILIAPLLLLAPVLLTALATYSLVGWLQHHEILQTEARDL